MTTPMHGHRRGGDNLADILERVLDKGIVIAGDVRLSLLDIDVLTIKLRLLVASVDTARSMGIDWWENDPFLSGSASAGLGDGGEAGRADELEHRIARLERATVGQLAAADREDEEPVEDRLGREAAASDRVEGDPAAGDPADDGT